MSLEVILGIIQNLGFPIACVIALAWFVYKIFKSNGISVEKMQARCKEREEKLYQEIEANRAVNEKAIETIAHYAEKLDTIQQDIKEIKTDITIIMTKN